jgi:predicted nucleotidyltransferase
MGMTDPVQDAVREIVSAAKRSLVLKRAILFGSRARADARPESDIDIAFEHESSDAEWAAFVNEMSDSAPTLLSLDLSKGIPNDSGPPPCTRSSHKSQWTKSSAAFRSHPDLCPAGGEPAARRSRELIVLRQSGIYVRNRRPPFGFSHDAASITFAQQCDGSRARSRSAPPPRQFPQHSLVRIPTRHRELGGFGERSGRIAA